MFVWFWFGIALLLVEYECHDKFDAQLIAWLTTIHSVGCHRMEPMYFFMDYKWNLQRNAGVSILWHWYVNKNPEVWNKNRSTGIARISSQMDVLLSEIFSAIINNRIESWKKCSKNNFSQNNFILDFSGNFPFLIFLC